MIDAPIEQYLDLDARWLRFTLTGLVVAHDGSLALSPLPFFAGLGPSTAVWQGAARIGVAPDGSLYVADPTGDRILRVDPCDGCVSVVPCLSRSGSDVGELDTPRGVMVSRRGELFVADSGNHRIQIFDRATGQVRGVWDRSFDTPWDLASDARGAVYVADPGVQDAAGVWTRGRVHKLSGSGRPDAAFAATLAAQPVRPTAPVAVAMGVLDGAADAERLLVLTVQPVALLVYRTDGTYDAAATAQWAGVAVAGNPVGLVHDGGALYVADASTASVLVFGADGGLVGVTPVPGGAVAGVAIDCRGRLVAHLGSGGAFTVASAGPSYVTCGTALGGPFSAPDVPATWQRIAVRADPIPPGAHLRVYTLSSDTLDGVAGRSPAPPVVCGTVSSPVPIDPGAVPPLAPLGQWRAAPPDATDLLALNAPARYLWIALVLESDGTATPTVRDIRVTANDDGWLRYLPALYRRDAVARVFLQRMLALTQSVMDDETDLIDDLPLLFDPYAAPDGGRGGEWLAWLATWLGAELDDGWDARTRRDVVAQAFATEARRGTSDSLRQLVALYTGVTPIIREVGVETGVWSLGGSALGLGTALATFAEQGPIVGSTAVLDRSRFLDAGAAGTPLLVDVAHRFVVQVYATDVPAGADGLSRLRAVLDYQKPAHTAYELCVIGPEMRVGCQARVGVDTVVGGPPLPGSLDGPHHLGRDTVLGDAPGGGREAMTIGDGARVGVGARLV